MHAIGIDMSKDTFHAALDDTTVLVFKNTDPGITLFLETLTGYGFRQKEAVVGVEATGIYHLLLCDRLTVAGWRIKVINPLLTSKMFSGVIRKVKTDKADARVIRKAVAVGLGYDFMETREVQSLKSLLSQRQALVKMRAKLKQQRGNHVIRTKAASMSLYNGYSSVTTVIAAEIKAIEQQMQGYAKETQILLRSIPGIGTTCSAVLVATIGDIRRFDSPEKLVAFIGLDCRVHQSGTSVNGKGYISKRGNAYLRCILFSAAFIAQRRDPELSTYFKRKKAEGKHHFNALCAVERKLIHRIYAVWTRGKPYEVR